MDSKDIPSKPLSINDVEIDFRDFLLNLDSNLSVSISKVICRVSRID